jgi:hypothetical protein
MVVKKQLNTLKTIKMENFATKNGVSVYAYKGDAMTLLAFDLDKSLIRDFAGFSIKVKAHGRSFYIYNRMKLSPSITLHRKPVSKKELFSTEFSPIQKFRWVHVPSTIHYVDNPYFGDYIYEICPRYIIDGKLQVPDPEKTVSVTIDVSPFQYGKVKLGFTRAFISSQAFAYHFGNHLNLRPNKEDLTFDIEQKAGSAMRYDQKSGKEKEESFTFKEIHEYLGWQARDRVMEFLDEVLQDVNLKLDVFAYDLNEPVVVNKLFELGKQGRLRILLDDYPNHRKPDCFEMKFEEEFNKVAATTNQIFRGHFSSQAHSKIFIQRSVMNSAKAIKVLTGSTNFTTNGLYINANHVVIFDEPAIAQVYADVFDGSFGKTQMKSFKNSDYAKKDFIFKGVDLPDMTIRFSPHPREIADRIFEKISKRILAAESDVLFAVMDDTSNSKILDAIKAQVQSDQVFTYGISDEADGLQLYKPDSKKGIKISALQIETNLPEPFSDIIKVPGLGHMIHHKFIVVDFKGSDPVVYCGSSNLAYNPEQNNGDNLIEIRGKEIATVFAIEAIRLIDHYHWLNKGIEMNKQEEEMFLFDNSEKVKWYNKYYNPKDLRCLERGLLTK